MKIQRIGRMPTKKELLASLARGILPVKFCYPNEGGDRWDELRKNKSYSLGRREYATLVSELRKIKTSGANVIHLGPGNGIEIPALAEALDFGKIKYFAVDISKRMLQNTWRYQQSALEKMSGVHFVLSDIEAPGNLEKISEFARKKGNKHNLWLVTGQGVLCSNKSFLNSLACTLKQDDRVFITVEGDDSSRREEILSTYDMFQVESLLKIGLKYAGFARGRFLPAHFNESLHRVEKSFVTEDGRIILCLTSYKPSSRQQFIRNLNTGGLIPEFTSYYPETHTYSAFCGGKNV